MPLNSTLMYIMSFDDNMAWFRPCMDHDTTSICQKLWFHCKNQQDMLPFSRKKILFLLSPLAHNDLKKTIILHDS